MDWRPSQCQCHCNSMTKNYLKIHHFAITLQWCHMMFSMFLHLSQYCCWLTSEKYFGDVQNHLRQIVILCHDVPLYRCEMYCFDRSLALNLSEHLAWLHNHFHVCPAFVCRSLVSSGCQLRPTTYCMVPATPGEMSQETAAREVAVRKTVREISS